MHSEDQIGIWFVPCTDVCVSSEDKFSSLFSLLRMAHFSMASFSLLLPLCGEISNLNPLPMSR